VSEDMAEFSEEEQKKLNLYLLENPRPGNIWVTMEHEVEILIIVEIIDDDIFICDDKLDNEDKWDFSKIILINKIQLKNRLTYLKHGDIHFIADVIPRPDKCKFILNKYRSLKCNNKIKYISEVDDNFNDRMLKFIDSDFKNMIYKIRLLRIDEIESFFKVREFEKLYQYLFDKIDD